MMENSLCVRKQKIELLKCRGLTTMEAVEILSLLIATIMLQKDLEEEVKEIKEELKQLREAKQNWCWIEEMYAFLKVYDMNDYEKAFY